jgi:hypothetical protein
MACVLTGHFLFLLIPVCGTQTGDWGDDLIQVISKFHMGT